MVPPEPHVIDDVLWPVGRCGLADLLLAWVAGGDAELAAVAELLGYEAAHDRADTKPIVVVDDKKNTPPGPDDDLRPPGPTSPAAWRLTRIEQRPSLPPPSGPPFGGTKALAPRDTRPSQRPNVADLAPWNALEPRLRTTLASVLEGRSPNIDALVKRVSLGEPIARVPYRRKRRWGTAVQILLDRSERLIPFRTDQNRVAVRLAARFPRHAVDYAVVIGGPAPSYSVAPRAIIRDYHRPSPGTLVVALGDLGCLAARTQSLMERWADFGRQLALSGCRLVALTPSPPSRWQRRQVSPWSLVPWEQASRGSGAADADRKGRAERLLRLLSLAVRIEPGLLRDVRRLLGADADAGTEADVWQDPALIGRSAEAATFDPTTANRLRRELTEAEPVALQVQVIDRIRQWRAGVNAEVWFEELLNLPPVIQASLPAAQRDGDVAAAHRFFCEDMSALVPSDPAAAAYYRRLYERATEDYHRPDDAEMRAAQGQMYLDAYRDDTHRPPPPPNFDPALARQVSGPLRPIDLAEDGTNLIAASADGASPGPAASPLGRVTTRNGLIHVLGDTFWTSGMPPSWADDWGWDEYGAWVTFTLKAGDHRFWGNPEDLFWKHGDAPFYGSDVTQRMRWIPPGTFLMGSPEDEPGRWEDEGPQHSVTISRGFWLFDTPCTQALWQAVMGDNPSKFKSPDRPVETVSWDGAQSFLAELNKLLPGLDLGLPTEAQWEYACRAGSTTALYTGVIDIVGNEAEALDPIAWYSGNSGGETHPVGSKRPNAWGLHDMLGNVFEWCADGQRTYEAGPETDPTGSLTPGVGHVVRGGFWHFNARGVRSACRRRGDPIGGGSFVGFRCAQVQLSPSGDAGAEPSDPASRGPAERPPPQGPTSGAGAGTASLLRLEGGQGSARCALPRGSSFQVLTDCERLTFTRTSKPDWADAMGRDRFGLWADIAVKDVRQRLRWIPPGRFLMGSPDNEPGRFDWEGPRHDVIMTCGFWMFSTPCTQALWEAVMDGANPSRYRSLDRPVECVGWDDVQLFLGKINERFSGLQLVLPTEAQWEYACRAGSTASLYSGGILIKGRRNAPSLDLIAWYGGNSSLDFELKNGTSTVDWPEMQENHGMAGTHPVGRKLANGWGLFDMLGNVWEWCRDSWRHYSADAQTDPLAPGEPCLARGGAWSDYARGVRPACRGVRDRKARIDSLGFRCCSETKT